MIEDSVLEDLLRDAGEAVRVPADGPDRVLAARDALRGHLSVSLPRPKAPSKWNRRRRSMVGAGALLAVLGGGIATVVVLDSSGSSTRVLGSAALGVENRPQTSSGVPAQEKALGASSAAGDVGAAALGAAEPGPLHSALPALPSAPTTGGVEGPPSHGPVAGVPLASKVIQTGSVTLQVPQGQVDPTINALSSLATGVGGFVSSTDTSSASPGTPASGDITLQIPVATFAMVLGDLKKYGTETAVTTSGKDVTSQYADLQSQIQAAQDTENQFEQIMTKAQSIGDILAVEQQISTIQSQIQQLQGQLQVMTSETTYSTLSITVSEKAKPATAAAKPAGPPSGFSKAFDHARHSFAKGIEAVVAWSGGFAVFLLALAVIFGLSKIGWLAIRRRLV